MNLLTQRDLIRGVAKKWRAAYSKYNCDPPLFSVRNGISKLRSKMEIADELDLLDPETATPEDVALVIGNDSWTRLKCDECKNEVDAVLIVGEKPDYESNTTSLCRCCVEAAAKVAWV